MNQIAIKVEGLSKKYRIKSAHQRHDTLRDHIAATLRRKIRSGAERTATTDVVWALKDVSFEVKKGEVLGIIGPNGAGKTTLLKILSRITEPAEGRAIIYGRVGSLLEVGTGFHPELTGRENTYLNAAILGMTRKEIENKFDEIVEFAGLERFLDTPVKRYSSGMYVRLAFAVAAHLEPEILVVDEVLAVGDAAFQKKCLGKMDNIAKGGRTVLFVSHNMPAISSLCDRVIWLNGGQIEKEGPARAVVSSYLNFALNKNVVDLALRTDRVGNGRLRFSKIWVTNNTGSPVDSLVLGEEAVFMLQYTVAPGEVVRNVFTALIIVDLYGQVVLTLDTRFTGENFNQLSGTGVLSCRLPALPLIPDMYSVYLWSSNGELLDCVNDAFQIPVIQSDFFGTGASVRRKHGVFVSHHSWSQVS